MGLTHQELSQKIKEAQEKDIQDVIGKKLYKANKKDSSNVLKALRVGTEIVSAILVGCLFGFWIDKIFNIAPFGMIIMICMGFVASILNVMRLEEDIIKDRNSNKSSDKG